MTATKTMHVTGATKDEINASFIAAMAHHTAAGKKRPNAATVDRLRRESAEAFAKLDGAVPAAEQAAASDEFTEAVKPDAVRTGSGEVVDMATKRASKAAKAAKPAPVAEETNKGGRPRVDRFPYCPACGFKFKAPQPRCNSKAACDKRAAALTKPVAPPKAVPVAKGA